MLKIVKKQNVHIMIKIKYWSVNNFKSKMEKKDFLRQNAFKAKNLTRKLKM